MVTKDTGCQQEQDNSGDSLSRPSTPPQEYPGTSGMPEFPKKRKKSAKCSAHNTSSSASAEPDGTRQKRRIVGETNPEPHLRKAWKIKGRLSFEEYLVKCSDEGRLEGKLEDKYNELIKDRWTEECDMVQSKGPRPTVDSSSDDTDVDISVLTIDEKVETALQFVPVKVLSGKVYSDNLH